MSRSEQELERICEERIAHGSKSFAFASTLFGRRERRGAFFLYAWCRASDDAIDQVPATEPASNRGAVSRARLLELRAQTGASFAGRGTAAQDAAFEALSVVAREFAIPECYAQDLLDGMESDVRLDQGEFRFETLEELRLYCYRVAGAVGILMSYVMGVSDAKALDAAAELGIAMQLTNISRDVYEDAQNGRVYLPAVWCREQGLEASPASLLDPGHRAKVHRVVLRCLAQAERSYTIGDQGLASLPFRAALAVGVASAVYRKIGRKIAQTPSDDYTGERAITSRVEKIQSAMGGLWLVLRTVPSRLRRPWRRADLTQSPLWRFESGRIDWVQPTLTTPAAAARGSASKTHEVRG